MSGDMRDIPRLGIMARLVARVLVAHRDRVDALIARITRRRDAWRTYLDLRKAARRETDPVRQRELARRASLVAAAYEFVPGSDANSAVKASQT